MLRSKQSRAYIFLSVSVAEADVRVRIRGRIVAVHRQQVRVVSVVAAQEATNRPVSTAAFSFCHRTQPHQLAATPIRMFRLAAGMDFCFNGAGLHLYTVRAKCCSGITTKKEAPLVTENDPLILEFSRRPPDGGIVAFGGRGKPRSFRLRFRSAALTLFGQVYVFYSAIRQQVPKPMTVLVFEDELRPYIVNGDRFEALALLPRKKPRTDRLPALALPPVNQLYLPT